MLALLLLSLILPSNPPAPDVRIEPLDDGYVRVIAPSYTVEVPEGWEVGRVTPYGSRDFEPADGAGDMNVMTAPPSESTWEDTYRTALYFILRNNPTDEPTAYKVYDHGNGIEAAAFVVKNADGFAYRRFVLLKHPTQGLMALSVRIPSEEDEEAWQKSFERLVETAEFTS